MAQTDILNAGPKMGAHGKNFPWYNPNLGTKLNSSARDLLENYSKIPAASVEEHVHRIRDEAWQVWPYPCIGGFRFLDLAIATLPEYPTILQRLKTGNENLLDLGCCFGQEIRRMVADGAPSEKLYGSDIHPEFLELGYAFFGDRDTLKSKFIAADFFDPNSGLEELNGKVDIVYAGLFLHLFEYEKQLEAAIRIVKLLREKEGSLLVGQQIGHLEAGERAHKSYPGQTMFKQSAESFAKMWEVVGERTGTKWKVDVKAEEIDPKDRLVVSGNADPGFRKLRFSVSRL